MRLATTLVMALAMIATQAPAASAADIAVSLPIDSVTVYRDSAIVTRSGMADIPAGQHRLIVRGLPDGIDPASLRLSARSASMRLGGIEVHRVVEEELVNATERALNRKLRDIGDQKSALEDEIISAQAQLKLLEVVISAPTGSGTNVQRLEPAALGTLVGSVGANDAAARQRVRAAKLQLRDLDEQAEKLKADIAKVATDHKATTELRASVQADTAGSVPVSIEYQVGNVGWNWQLRGAPRHSAEDHRAGAPGAAATGHGRGLEGHRAHHQHLQAQPQCHHAAFGIAVPQPGITGLRCQRRQARRSGGHGSAARCCRPCAQRRARVPAPTVALKSTAEVFSTDFVADYRIPGRVSVAADRQPRLYPINDDHLNVDLVARANLAVDRVAYLEAKFTYQNDVPIDAGEVQLFRDDAFVGMGALPVVLPGSEVRIPFGQDQRIRIVVHDESEESGNVGIINRDQVNQRKRRFEITSFHALALPIEVIDRVPVARDDGIRIEILKGATPPTVTDLNGQAGVCLWRLAGEPRKTEIIRHYYSVKFPQSKTLASVEGA